MRISLKELNKRIGRVERIRSPTRISSELKAFVPTAKQKEFTDAVFSGKYHESFFLGANRSGKTKIGAYLGSMIAINGFPWALGKPTAGWVISLDFPMSRDTVQPYYFKNGYGVGIDPFIDESEIDRFDRQSQTLFLKNGSLIAFKSCDSGATKFQGAGKDWANKDEVIPREIDDEMSIRVKAGHKLVQWTTATLLPPEGKVGNMYWLYEKIVKPWKNGLRENWITNASIYDNPHILKSEINRLESRYPFGSKLRQIRLEGALLPGISGSQVYSGFANQVHVVPEFPINDSYPVMWAWDFNVSPMCSLICQKIDGIVHVQSEFWMDEGSILEMVELFKSKISQNHPVWIYGDATGNARSPHTRRTSYQIIVNDLVSSGYVSKQYVPEANPSETDRINTVNTAFFSLEGKSYIRISRSCENLITDLESVVYDDNNKIRKSNRTGDVYRWRTHISDAFGYLIHKALPMTFFRKKDSNIDIKRLSYGKGYSR